MRASSRMEEGVEVKGFILEVLLQEEPVWTGSLSVRPWPCR